MRRLLLTLLLCSTVWVATPGAQFQTWINFLGAESRGPETLVGVGGSTYVWPGWALSASVNKAWFQFGFLQARYVRWLLAWNPQGSTNSGVRIVHADDGPSNITQMAEITGSTAVLPIVSAVDVTEIWNSLTVAAVSKQLGMQLRGAPLVYRSTLEVVY